MRLKLLLSILWISLSCAAFSATEGTPSVESAKVPGSSEAGTGTREKTDGKSPDQGKGSLMKQIFEDKVDPYPRLVLNLVFAVLIGSFGAWAFYSGVKTGFIDRGGRDKVLEFLSDTQLGSRIHDRIGFIFLGGVVAGVFQAAQIETLAPIQAFVLGATWPSVVTRIMSGGNGAAGSLASGLADASPDKIRAPKGTVTARDAEVVIN